MDSEKKKVPVIDDLEEIRDLVTVTRKDSEFEVITAPNGRVGIEKAKE